MPITKKNLISSCLYSLMNVFMFMLLVFNQDKFDLITYLAFFQLLISVLLIAYINKKLFTIAALFLILSFLFHFGQSIIISFGFNDVYAHRNVLSETSYELYIKSEIFTFISHFFLTIGMVYAPNFYQKTLSNEHEEDIMLRKLKIISLTVICISIIPLIYLDILKLLAVRTSGYLSTYSTYSSGINKYLGLIAQFCRPAITMFLISIKKENKKNKIIFILSSIYYIVMMLSGDRGTNMIYLLANIFVYYKIIKQVKVRTIIYASIAGYILLGFISSINILRSSADMSFEAFISYFAIRSKDGIIYSTLREFGGTIKTLCYAIQFIPSYTNYNYGLTYIFSWLIISPVLPEKIINLFNTNFTFVNAFPESYQYSLGGSYLGELFFNFGWIGSFFAIFIGAFVGFINNLIENSIKKNNWLIFSICMILFPNLLLWIRGYFVELIFKVFWLGFFTLIMYYSSDLKKKEQ